MLDKPCSRLLLWTCRLAGLAPMCLGGPRGPRRSRVWELYSIVVLFSLTAGACIAVLAAIDSPAQNRTLSSTFTEVTGILVVLTTVLVHATTLLRCGAQRTALRLLASCESLIGALTPERCLVALWWIVVQLASWLAMQLFYVLFRAFEARIFDYQDTLQFLCDPALHLTFVQFESVALVLYLQMASVNKQLKQCLKLPAGGMSPDILEEMIQQGPGKSTHGEPFNDNDGSVLETVRDIRALHHQVWEACGQVQTAYGLQMLLLLMRSFVVTTTTLYTTLAARRMIQHIGSFVIVCFKVVVLYLVLTAGHLVKNEAKQIAETLQLALVYHQMSTEIQKELKDFSLNLLRLPTILSAGGFLPLDHTIVHGFVGLITTYLVIILQFSPGSDAARSLNSTLENNKTRY